jgi:hypothetical protein
LVQQATAFGATSNCLWCNKQLPLVQQATPKPRVSNFFPLFPPQKATTAIVAWFADRTCNNHCKWCASC